nr:MAG TPA: hypothetical protein [Caudoviricetes sp.]
MAYAIITLQLSTKCDSKETRARCHPKKKEACVAALYKQ